MHGRKPHSGPVGPFKVSGAALLACALGLLAIAPGAQAVTKAKKTGTGSSAIITITTDAGVEHDISISYDPDQTRYEISDAAPMGDEVGCNYTADPDDQIVCPAATPVAKFKIITGDQDDSISVDLDGGEETDISTGAGDDFVDGLSGHDYVDTGTGDDAIDGNDGPDTLSGGPGEDIIDGGSENDFLDGGDGDDALSGDGGADSLQGGPGVDLADYVTVRTAVTVDLDGNGDDGREGEHDNVKPDVEDIRGGSGNDVLSGSDASNMLSGGDGNDLLNARDSSADRVFCGRGADTAIVDPLDSVDPKCDKTEKGKGPSTLSFKIVISNCTGKTRNASTACVRIRCQGAQGSCSGKVSLQATLPRRARKGKKARQNGKKADLAKRRSRPKPVKAKIGSSSFKVAEGGTATVSVRLSKQGAKLLGKKGRLAVRAIVAAADQGGASEGDIGTVRLAAKVKAAKKRR